MEEANRITLLGIIVEDPESAEKINRLLARNCGQTYEKLVADTDRDYIMDAEEALKYGIIDRIIETVPKALQM